MTKKKSAAKSKFSKFYLIDQEGEILGFNSIEDAMKEMKDWELDLDDNGLNAGYGVAILVPLKEFAFHVPETKAAFVEVEVK